MLNFEQLGSNGCSSARPGPHPADRWIQRQGDEENDQQGKQNGGPQRERFDEDQ